MVANVVINQRDDGTWACLLDGRDIADTVAGCTVRISGAGQPASVVLELMDLTAFTGPGEVFIDAQLANLLRQLGWQPPEEQA